MALSIKDPETETLARRLAAATGETITTAIKTAVRERLAREEGRGREDLAERLLAIGRRAAASMTGEFHSLDHGELLYDEEGLPR